ncbi:hypothetical protein C8R46DRAFT_1040906 [Mycena filopes]|nr:hypothetical protein C8R46DRAFT_1040906 [Mycena filopes]
MGSEPLSSSTGNSEADEHRTRHGYNLQLLCGNSSSSSPPTPPRAESRASREHLSGLLSYGRESVRWDAYSGQPLAYVGPWWASKHRTVILVCSQTYTRSARQAAKRA